MQSEQLPKYVYFLALTCSGFILAVTFLLLLEYSALRAYVFALPSLLCAVSAGSFAWIWPTASWRWGIWVSSACALYFGFVFFSFLINGDIRWSPALQVVLVISVAGIGAWAGSVVSCWRRSTTTRSEVS